MRSSAPAKGSRDWFRERRHTCDGLRSRCSRERVRLVAFNGVKVFSATLQRQRDELGEGVSQWLAANPAIRVVETVVWQSSGAEFHCLSITLFYEQEVGG